MIHGITENYAQVGPWSYQFADYAIPLPLAKAIAKVQQLVVEIN